MANQFKPSYEILCLHISVLQQHNGKHNTTQFPLSWAQPGSHTYTLIRRNLTGTNTIGIAPSYSEPPYILHRSFFFFNS